MRTLHRLPCTEQLVEWKRELARQGWLFLSKIDDGVDHVALATLTVTIVGTSPTSSSRVQVSSRVDWEWWLFIHFWKPSMVRNSCVTATTACNTVMIPL